MLLLYTVCVVEWGRASVMVFSLLFFKLQYKKFEKKNKHDVSGSKCGETKASGISVL